MLRSQVDGMFLADSPDRGLHLATRGDDCAMWRLDDKAGDNSGGGASDAVCSFTSAVVGSTINARAYPTSPNALEPSYRLDVSGDLPAIYDAIAGPFRLPSSHMAELRETGMTVVGGFCEATCAALRAAVLKATLHTVVNLSSPDVVASSIDSDSDAGSDLLHLSVPRGRRGSTGGEGIQVLRRGEVVQGAPDAGGQSVTIPFDSITGVELTSTTDSAMTTVRISQGGGSKPFQFGVDDIDEARALRAQIQHVALDRQEEVGGSSQRLEDFWDGDQGHLFGRMHCHPVMLWLLEQSFGAPARCGGHTPQAKTIMPQDGSRGPGQGWHSDTPCE